MSRAQQHGADTLGKDYCVFIHTNAKQMLGARVGSYALRRNSPNADKFDVRIIHTDDYPFMREFEGRRYLRDGVSWTWLNDDLQSFTPLRFAPPKLMGYKGRAVLTDPDIFAVGDIWELLSRDMQGKAILSRMRSGPKGLIDKVWASSVMLLDCAKLAHWDVERGFCEMFDGRRDYQHWVGLKLENQEDIGTILTASRAAPACCTTPSAAPSRGRRACLRIGAPRNAFDSFRPPLGYYAPSAAYLATTPLSATTSGIPTRIKNATSLACSRNVSKPDW